MLFKRAREEIVQSEKEMRNLLKSLRTAISNLEEKKQSVLSSYGTDSDFLLVLINQEQERLIHLLQKSISIIRQEPNLYFITNDYQTSGVGSLFLNSQPSDGVQCDTESHSEFSDSESESCSNSSDSESSSSDSEYG